MFDKIVTRIEKVVMLTSYITLILVVSLETLRRMFTGQQFGWGPDVAMYAFVWLAWFAMSANLRADNQLAMLTFREKFSSKVQKYLKMMDYIIWLIVGGVVIVTSYKVVQMDLRLGRTVFGTDIPLAAASLAVPLGWAFSVIRILQQLYWLLSDSKPEDLKTDNASEFG
jgi:TRAP-type C4-dicarboxylate transport system permease small subunit